MRAALACALLLAGCRTAAPPPRAQPETAWSIYRFDDHFSSATVSAPQAGSAVAMAEPVVWSFDEKVITWDLVRGNLGFKPGQLIVKGDNASPVIVSPSRPPIDWSRYERILIRMIAEGGRELKLKLGDLELRQPLAPPMEWQVYRFDLKLAESTFTRPMAIMPTDDLNAPVAIDFIELVPRKVRFQAPAGVTNVAKREEYRNALFAGTPSSITYEVPVPKGGLLTFGLGVSSKAPVTFRVLVADREAFSKTVSDPEAWDDASVDLGAYAGGTQKLVFRAEGQDAVALWANPVLTTRARKNRPNILLYVVCTLRPDHTSLYGYARDTTPFLKKLGAEGVVFDDCHANAPWTKPSVASLMTSLHAYTHGLVNDADTIPKGAPVLAEALRAAGYVTASIVANPFAGRTSGLERGFDYLLEYPVVQRYRNEETDRGTDSAAINRAIVPWLERHRDEPFFLYVQSTDPHAPYRPPAEFERLWANPAETPPFNRDYAKLRDIRAYGGGATVTRAEMRAKGVAPEPYIRRAIDRYDAEIAHNDRHLEALVRKLDDNTVVVVASDHGEEFWEHGYGAHGHSLYSELIRAALVVWRPGQFAARRVAEPVQLIDLAPTLLELAGAQPPPAMQGQSLMPLLLGQPFRRNAPVMASKLALPRAKPGSGVPENLTDTFARLDPAWKFLYRTRGAKPFELYDRRTDPGDRTDVAPQHPDLAARFKAEVLQWIEAQKAVRKQLGPGGKTTLDPRALERLRGLGYLGGKQ